jgi:hypothetical protein
VAEGTTGVHPMHALHIQEAEKEERKSRGRKQIKILSMIIDPVSAPLTMCLLFQIPVF